eukprot:GHVU01157537.1.p1 GENE.GHVU01157537.1~~GHVU01157537.1.p1  ORF type:complete len:446 (+),score=33.35 GHVU01157537.1:84-1421(+)
MSHDVAMDHPSCSERQYDVVNPGSTEMVELEEGKRSLLHSNSMETADIDKFSDVMEVDRRTSLLFEAEGEHAYLIDGGKWDKEDTNRIIVGTVFGMLTGLCLIKSGIFVPDALFSQFTFKHWIPLKLFTATGATICLVNIIYSESSEHYNSVRSNGGAGLGLLGVLVGGIFMGAGLALGACGTLTFMAQTGAGMWYAGCFGGGALIAAIVYGLGHPKVWSSIDNHWVPKEDYVDIWLGIRYWYISLVMMVLLGGSSFAMEWYFPWDKDLSKGAPAATAQWWTDYKGAYPPYVVGVVLGLIHIGVRSSIHVYGSFETPYMTLAGVMFKGWIDNFAVDYVRMMNATWKACLWQAWFVIAVGGGSVGTAILSDVFQKGESFPYYMTAIAGFCVVFGAFIAYGDPISYSYGGVPDLSIRGCVGSATIFASAVGVSLLLKQLGFDPSKGK